MWRGASHAARLVPTPIPGKLDVLGVGDLGAALVAAAVGHARRAVIDKSPCVDGRGEEEKKGGGLHCLGGGGVCEVWFCLLRWPLVERSVRLDAVSVR